MYNKVYNEIYNKYILISLLHEHIYLYFIIYTFYIYIINKIYVDLLICYEFIVTIYIYNIKYK